MEEKKEETPSVGDVGGKKPEEEDVGEEISQVDKGEEKKEIPSIEKVEKEKTIVAEKQEEIKKEKKDFKLNIKDIYDKHYKKLLIIPISMLILAIILLIFQIATTGDFINKDVSLKGGVTVTIPTEENVNIINLREGLLADFINNDVDVRSLKKGGAQSGIIITSDIDGTKKEELDLFIGSIEKHLNRKFGEADYSIEVIGSALGLSFFKEVIRALIIAFIFMGIVVLIYFRVLIPSLALILAAFSDIIVSLSIVNLIGIKVNTAGIAAFLMLIGYAVDTNILLSTKVLKRREGRTVFGSILNAMKTGLMMSLTTILAIIVALVFTQSEIIRQIMVILLIGLFVDLINTWLGNSALLRLYVERKLRKNE